MANYNIQRLQCVCTECRCEFNEFNAADYELVCFENNEGEKIFLPSYGKYGYLYLLKKLVKGWDNRHSITKSVTDEFEKKLANFTPYRVSLFQKIKCPNCKSFDIHVSQRENLFNFPVKWLEIDTDKCDTEEERE